MTLDPNWRKTGQVNANQYLLSVLQRETVDTGPNSPVRRVANSLMPLIREWAGNVLLDVHPSGSFMKGTAVLSGTDIDLFISISETCPNTLKEIYERLFQRLVDRGYQPRRQNVSINIRTESYSVDLVPAKRQNSYATDHSLYRRRADTWMKTNVLLHIGHVLAGGRQAETRILKLWRNQNNLDFPSFYLELVVIEALSGTSLLYSTLESRIHTVFDYLRDRFPNARFVDPANTNNVVSDDLSATAKQAISAAARAARLATYWENIVR